MTGESQSSRWGGKSLIRKIHGIDLLIGIEEVNLNSGLHAHARAADSCADTSWRATAVLSDCSDTIRTRTAPAEAHPRHGAWGLMPPSCTRDRASEEVVDCRQVQAVQDESGSKRLLKKDVDRDRGEPEGAPKSQTWINLHKIITRTSVIILDYSP